MKAQRLAAIRFAAVFAGLAAILAPLPVDAAGVWGRLANAGFTNQRIKATPFFAGQALDGSDYYGCAPGNNLWAYTMSPVDDIHLKWSESAANRHLALNQMLQAGINVVNMSSWGEDFLTCSWAWTGIAPMQTSPQSHDELFTATVEKPLLIIPFIESRGDWSLRNEFPRATDGRVSPGTVSQIVNLIDRYLKNASHPEWAEKWARVYNRQGVERYAVALIHVASNRLNGGEHAAFAAGFDALADEVFRLTGIKVGFLLDILPAGTGALGASFLASPEDTGPHLRSAESVLGIECFIPEIWIGQTDDGTRLNWKRDFSRRWFLSGVPFFMDVSPGYDGHLIFKTVPYGLTTGWLNDSAQMVRDFGQSGMVFNAWNGYTEGLVAVPTKEYGTRFFEWLKSLEYADVYARKPDAPDPRNGTWDSPYTLIEAVENVPPGGTIGLMATFSEPFDAPLTIGKACKLISVGGGATIGR